MRKDWELEYRGWNWSITDWETIYQICSKWYELSPDAWGTVRLLPDALRQLPYA